MRKQDAVSNLKRSYKIGEKIPQELRENVYDPASTTSQQFSCFHNETKEEMKVTIVDLSKPKSKAHIDEVTALQLFDDPRILKVKETFKDNLNFVYITYKDLSLEGSHI
jgi:hypothetical protein